MPRGVQRGGRLVIALLLAIGCRPSQSTEAPTTATPRLLLLLDEAAGAAAVTWSVSVEPDGRYRVLAGFDAGSSSFENECDGVRPAAEIAPWFDVARTKASATEPTPSVERGGFHIAVSFTDESGVRRYLDPADVSEELAAWAAVFTDC